MAAGTLKESIFAPVIFNGEHAVAKLKEFELSMSCVISCRTSALEFLKDCCLRLYEVYW